MQDEPAIETHKVCLLGAGGGIGRQLLKDFAAQGSVTGVYRSIPAIPLAGTKVARSGYPDELADAVRNAEVVVHAALDTKSKGKLLALIEPGRTRLFVYFSSQVVYAALDPVAHPLQDETAKLEDRGGLDAYTRLKLLEEARVIEACREKGVDYLIVRPTVVMGPNMDWSSGIVAAMRLAPLGLKGRTINLIHVEDLSRQLLALIERGVHNKIVNLGHSIDTLVSGP